MDYLLAAVDTSGGTMPNAPCLSCRESHQRCDKRRPVCRRCETKGLDCRPVQRKAVFRHGSTAKLEGNFTQGQTWVNSVPKAWKPTTCHLVLGQSPDTVNTFCENGEIDASPTPSDFVSVQDESNTNETNPDTTASIDSYHHGQPSVQKPPYVLSSPQSSLTSTSLPFSSDSYSSQTRKRRRISHGSSPSTWPRHDTPGGSSGAVQESCLMRYFIEELSPWFDHCDDRRHFQLEVPRRAKYCSTLKLAIFAVAARHLDRLPKYKTTHGVVYCGQSLPNLKKSSALEYMLKCIPDLIQFPEIQDPDHQANIMAATVILRQYEEMDEEMDDGDIDGNYHTLGRVNFLAITKTIIDSMTASPLDQSLANAAYWITVRQEIYYALTRETVPHLRFDWQPNHPNSVANNAILFAGEVAQWRWGKQLPEDWAQLKLKEQQLVQDSIGELEPILELKADRSKGDIFPTTWYGFDIQVTAIQHLRLAQVILNAENPHLDTATRVMHRKTEARVRSIVFEICGLALHHPRVQPALVNAVIAITLYGEYFTDPVERDALVDIINKTKDVHAWPMRNTRISLERRWELMDSAET